MNSLPVPRWSAVVLAVTTASALHVTVPRSASAQSAAFSPGGTYALRVVDGRDTIRFQIVIADSAGHWGGQFTSSTGRVRPLIAVVPQPDSSRVIVQYLVNSAFATMLLRVRADSVRGAAEFVDGTFVIYGTRSTPSSAAASRTTSTAPASAPR